MLINQNHEVVFLNMTKKTILKAESDSSLVANMPTKKVDFD